MADRVDSQKVPPVKKGGPFKPGYDERRGKSGGRPRAVLEIERMLDAEHRTPDNMREVFTRLKELAMEDIITAHTDEKGVEHVTRRPPNPAFMSLYLERTLGPVKDLDIDLSDAPVEVVRWWADKVN